MSKSSSRKQTAEQADKEKEVAFVRGEKNADDEAALRLQKVYGTKSNTSSSNNICSASFDISFVYDKILFIFMYIIYSVSFYMIIHNNLKSK